MCPEVSILGVRIGSYGLMYVCGIFAALLIALHLGRKLGLNYFRLLLLCIGTSAAGFVGAAVTYALVTYTPSELIDGLKNGSLKLGLVFYGGLIAGLLMGRLLTKLMKLSYSLYSRAIIPALPLAHAYGRIGCFAAGCCFGIESESCFAVSMPGHINKVLPVQLFEAAALLIICAVLLYKAVHGAERLTNKYILLYAPLRFILEFLRGDEIRGKFGIFTTSQWFSILLLIYAFISERKHRYGS